ncbi:MAG: hypothetical protein WEF99_11345 [Thermoanaerobaculia bacterium]
MEFVTLGNSVTVKEPAKNVLSIDSSRPHYNEASGVVNGYSRVGMGTEGTGADLKLVAERRACTVKPSSRDLCVLSTWGIPHHDEFAAPVQSYVRVLPVIGRVAVDLKLTSLRYSIAVNSLRQDTRIGAISAGPDNDKVSRCVDTNAGSR